MIKSQLWKNQNQNQTCWLCAEYFENSHNQSKIHEQCLHILFGCSCMGLKRLLAQPSHCSFSRLYMVALVCDGFYRQACNWLNLVQSKQARLSSAVYIVEIYPLSSFRIRETRKKWTGRGMAMSRRAKITDILSPDTLLLDQHCHVFTALTSYKVTYRAHYYHVRSDSLKSHYHWWSQGPTQLTHIQKTLEQLSFTVRRSAH